MSTAKDTSSTHRVGLTENEILELIEELTDMKNSGGLSMILRSAYVKLMDKYNKIDNGTVRADYVPNGRKRESKINMDSLGITEEDKQTSGLGKFNNPAELSDDVWAQVERDERKMLEELAAAGNKNIILAERREEDRTYQEDSHPTDNDNVHKLFMALKTSDL